MNTSHLRDLDGKTILGIDPGTNILGYALIRLENKKVEMLTMGVIEMQKITDPYEKLSKIFNRITSIIDEFKPDELAIEAPFYGQNVQSMLKLGRAQGVAIAAALSRSMTVNEYAPRKVKMSITGNGTASKEQVASMLQAMLSIKDMPRYFDATDALGVAFCHSLQHQLPKGKDEKKTRSSSNSWKDFISKNPDRLL